MPQQQSVLHTLTPVFAAFAGLALAHHARDFSYLYYRRKFRAVHGMGAIAFLSAILFDLAVLLSVPYVHDDPKICHFSIHICVFFYGATKLWTYLFFIERARVARATNIRRWEDRIFKKHLLLLLVPYTVIVVLMNEYEVHDFGPTHSALSESAALSVDDDPTTTRCNIGLGKPATIPLVVYDTLFSVYITWHFVVPVLWPAAHKAGPPSPGGSTAGQKDHLATARRNLLGAGAALVSSLGNIASVVAFRSLKAHVCLACCLADTFVCSMAVWYMAASSLGRRLRRRAFFEPERPAPPSPPQDALAGHRGSVGAAAAAAGQYQIRVSASETGTPSSSGRRPWGWGSSQQPFPFTPANTARVCFSAAGEE